VNFQLVKFRVQQHQSFPDIPQTNTAEFIKDQFRHCKTILALGASASLLKAAGIDGKTPQGKPDAGVIVAQGGSAAAGLEAFIKGVASPRDFSRETDPPRV
jgi:catalase